MTDYAEEQTNELEVLRSIFPDEFEELDPGPPAHFRIHVKPDQDGAIEVPSNASLYLTITYTDTYPDTLPILALDEVEGLEGDEEETLLKSLTELGEESLGMAMVFSLAASAKETFERLIIERKERRIAAEEEAERQRHTGTRVTPSSFEMWKAAFMAEIASILKAPKAEESLTPAQRAAAAVAGLLDNKSKDGKLTGRQLFEKDRTLAKSDAAFMEEGDVTVDVELFEGMEDLEIEDDDNSD